jgi:hypothetical protein
MSAGGVERYRPPTCVLGIGTLLALPFLFDLVTRQIALRRDRSI